MENEMVNRTAEYSAKATKAKEPRVNWEKSYIIVEQSDSFLEALEYAELDFYSNTSSTEAERAVSCVRKLKKSDRSTMPDEREGDLNFDSASKDNRCRQKWSY